MVFRQQYNSGNTNDSTLGRGDTCYKNTSKMEKSFCVHLRTDSAKKKIWNLLTKGQKVKKRKAVSRVSCFNVGKTFAVKNSNCDFSVNVKNLIN